MKEKIAQHKWKKLTASFYKRKDVVVIAKELIGKILVTHFDKTITTGIIIETEAYNGVVDKASHSFGGRRTSRTKVMYANGGVAYVYLCYGIHHLFNIVTNEKDIPHAILIRGIAPIEGKEKMLARMKKTKWSKPFIQGPGNVSKALGIYTHHTGINLLHDEIFIVDNGIIIPDKMIETTARIGVDYAGDDALLPYRFIIKEEWTGINH